MHAMNLLRTKQQIIERQRKKRLDPGNAPDRRDTRRNRCERDIRIYFGY
jgi:hypothetical protein